ncbi:hypothetical protein TRVA0_003S00738 [Trichomonascus vanleenenianus]|uniref:uncharacterized protein n=1 Tax=Trichomonascus vanleenenianus TaxID=2268995 RepID=UPI003ECB1D94
MASTEETKLPARYPTFKYREDGMFQPRDTIALTTKAAFLSSGAGIFVAAIKASLAPNRSFKSSVLAHSRYVWLYGAVGTAYTAVEAITANLTESDSAWSTFYGGAAAGGIMGTAYKSVSKVIGGAIAVGAILSFAHWSGNFTGYGRKQAQENSRGEAIEIEKGNRQGFFDVVHRRPLSQTIDELGDLVKPFK